MDKPRIGQNAAKLIAAVQSPRTVLLRYVVMAMTTIMAIIIIRVKSEFPLEVLFLLIIQ
jgi:hypothetical protein